MRSPRSFSQVSFLEFVSRAYRPQPRYGAQPSDRLSRHGRGVCIDNFVDGEVQPCVPDAKFGPYLKRVGLPRGQMPVYETASPADQRALGADPGQAWFDNILRMRGAKLRDFYAIQRWATHFELVLHDNLTRSADATPAFLRRLRDEYGLPVRKPGLFKAADASEREYLAGFNARNFYFNRGARCERPVRVRRALARRHERAPRRGRRRHLGASLRATDRPRTRRRGGLPAAQRAARPVLSRSRRARHLEPELACLGLRPHSPAGWQPPYGRRAPIDEAGPTGPSAPCARAAPRP